MVGPLVWVVDGWLGGWLAGRRMLNQNVFFVSAVGGCVRG